MAETDGFGLRAAVLNATRGAVSFERVVQTQEADPDAALSEVVSALRADGGVLPGEAILRTATALPALLDLPVSPSGPLRPYPQMQEMVRWEMEPFFVQRVGVWPLEKILLRRGFLRPDRIEEARRDIARYDRPGESATHPAADSLRLGEWAVARGWITAAQLEECLAIQKRLQTTDDEIVCGWSALLDKSDAGSPERAGRKFPWLVCGIGRADRVQWVQRFGLQGLLLQGIYPLVGCAAAALNGDLGDGGMVIETHGDMMGCMRLAKGRPVSLQVLYHPVLHPVSPSPDAGTDESDPSDVKEGAVYWTEEAGVSPSAPLRRKESPIGVTVAPGLLPVGMKATTLSGLLGAARHHWKMAGGERTASVPAFDPGPPLWLRPEVWWIGAGLLTLLLIGGMEGAMAIRLKKLRQRHAEVRHTLSERERTDQALLSLQKEVTTLETKLSERKTALQSLAERLREAATRGTGRSERIATLLDRVTMALPETVTLTRVSDTSEGIQVGADSYSDADLAEFSQRLSEALLPLDLRIERIETRMNAVPETPDEVTHAMTLRLTQIRSKAPPPPTNAGPQESPSLMDKMVDGLRGLVGKEADGQPEVEAKEEAEGEKAP